VIKDAVLGLLQFVVAIASGVFMIYFIMHVLFTPDEGKIREIIREELSQFKENDENE